MTIQELYGEIGGNYAHAVQIMKKDKMIHKYLLKLGASGVYENLKAAGESMDPARLFEAGHAMKGVCANLGLDELAETVGAITEEYRPGSPRKLSDEQVKALLEKANVLYAKAESGIQKHGGELVYRIAIIPAAAEAFCPQRPLVSKNQKR